MIEINRDVCIGCLACAGVCPSSCLTAQDGFPHISDRFVCLDCMHCACVCPVGAIGFEGEPAVLSEEKRPVPAGFDTALEGFIKARRSYRHFDGRPVDRKLLECVLDAVNWAPSAKNTHPARWIVVQSRETIAEMMDIILQFASKTPWLSEICEKYAMGNNVVTGTAQTIIFGVTSKGALRPADDTFIAMAQMELLLQSKGIGTFWGGYLAGLAGMIPEIRQGILGLSDTDKLHGALLAGYPDGEDYPRLPVRVKKCGVTWI